MMRCPEANDCGKYYLVEGTIIRSGESYGCMRDPLIGVRLQVEEHGKKGVGEISASMFPFVYILIY